MITQINNQIKHCIECNCELILCDNWRESSKRNYIYICNDCSYEQRCNWIIDNPEKEKASQHRCDTRRKGSPKRIATNRKHHNKERGLGDKELFPNSFVDSVKVDWHHPSDEFVIAIPRDLHELYNSNQLGLEGHRFMIRQIIEQIYEGE